MSPEERDQVPAVVATATIIAVATAVSLTVPEEQADEPDPVETTADIPVIPEFYDVERSRDTVEGSRSGVRDPAPDPGEPLLAQSPATDHPPAVPPPPPPPPPEPEPAPETAPPAPEPALADYVLPLVDYRITATFGESGPNWSSTHTGLDFAAGAGSRIGAVHGGEVIFAGWDGAYGNKVTVRHEDGSEASYAHLSSISGSGWIGTGDKVGEVGETGNTTGPHLHLEIRVGGALVDPAAWLAERGVTP